MGGPWGQYQKVGTFLEVSWWSCDACVWVVEPSGCSCEAWDSVVAPSCCCCCCCDDGWGWVVVVVVVEPSSAYIFPEPVYKVYNRIRFKKTNNLKGCYDSINLNGLSYFDTFYRITLVFL